ncbi:PorV/PorQ family protein [candidate division KSB1 bacterium]|nr:PorV/PorQ family protein [candidate division KSB1 bacterium]
MKSPICILLVFISLSSLTIGQTYSPHPLFLTINSGARAAGMGNTGTALANDVSAIYLNPAGLARQTGREFEYAWSKYSPNTDPDIKVASAIFKIRIYGIGTFGLGYLHFAGDENPIEPSAESPDGKRIRPKDTAFILSYGTQLSAALSAGFNIKYAKSQKVDVTLQEASFLCYDVGILYAPNYLRNAVFGINIANLGLQIQYSDQNFKQAIPTMLKLGMAYKLINNAYTKLNCTLDFNKIMVKMQIDENSEPEFDPVYQALFTSWSKDQFNFGCGFEYWYAGLLALRTGYIFDKNEKSEHFATSGFSIRYALYEFDLSYLFASQTHPYKGRVQLALKVGF